MKPAEKRKAKDLLRNFSNKEVAQMLKVTEKTVGLWAKEFRKEEDTLKIIKSHIHSLTIEVMEIKKLLLSTIKE